MVGPRLTHIAREGLDLDLCSEVDQDYRYRQRCRVDY